jgi:hypothetical protein
MSNWRSYFPKLSANPQKVSAQSSSALSAKYAKDQLSEPFADLQMESEPSSVEAVLNGRAIELWSEGLGERFWLVADEADVARLREPRGMVYTAAEARRIVAVGDPSVVREIHEWKHRFDGVVREFRKHRD